MGHEYMEIKFQAFMPSQDDEFDRYVLPHDSDEDFDPYILPDDDEVLSSDRYVLPHDSDEDFDPYILPDDDEVPEGYLPETEDLSAEFSEVAAPSMPAGSLGFGFVVYEGRLMMAVIESTEQCRTCAICLDEMEVGREAAVLDCSHKFHEDCLRPWLAEKLACPYCRAAVEVDY